MINKDILEKINQAKNSQSLSFSKETITDEIWNEILKITDLQVLYFNDCNIETVPYEISSLTNLEGLKLEGNKLNATQFEYNFWESGSYKTNLKIFDCKTTNFKVKGNTNNLFFENEKNYGFGCVISGTTDNPSERKTYSSTYFFIYIFGNPETQKDLLKQIRTCIDRNIKEEGLEFSSAKKEKLVTRHFNYLNSQINYEKLLNLKIAKKSKYFDDSSGKTFLVKDLLEYIGAENDSIEKTWQGTDYITKVSIKNFKIQKALEIQLSKNINIFLGNNGLGKTSLLQAITLGLLPTDNIDTPTNLNDYIRFKEDNSEIRMYWGENENRQLYLVRNEQSADGDIFIPPTQLLLSYGVNFNTNKNQEHDKIVSELVEGKNKLYFTESIFKENYQNLHNPLTIFKDLDGRSTKNTEAPKLKQLLLETLNDYLALVDESERMQIRYDEDERRYYFLDFYQNQLGLEHLSEGYKDHILLLTDILVRILASRKTLFEGEKNIEINKELLQRVRAVILIDEFDRHLHPSWQKNLLSKFKADFPCIQFILTTHNPMSILDRDAKEIIELKTNEKGQIIAFSHQEGTKYLDISRIYLKYFVKDIVSTELHEDLEQYNQLLLSNSRNSEEFKRLESKLKAAHIGYEITDLRYWKFLDFLKRFPDKNPLVNHEIAGEWDFTDQDWNDLLNELNS